ncbi:TPA: hypothetical protein EYP66_18705 [Candidatus Poribacteria bacterium]|nr:hypothetical protein [Candidatus Poribacteria bacterium]
MRASKTLSLGRTLLSLTALLLCFTLQAIGAEENLIGVANGGKLVESVGNLPAWPDEDWNGAIDGDLETWAGTVTVFNAPPEGDPHPWAIFAFKDEKTTFINKARFFMLTEAVIAENLQSRCGKDFVIEVSTTGTDEGNFKTALKDTVKKLEKEWEEFEFPAVRAKYVKLTWESNYGDGTYTTMGEFEVYGGTASVKPLGKLTATWAQIKSE